MLVYQQPDPGWHLTSFEPEPAGGWEPRCQRQGNTTASACHAMAPDWVHDRVDADSAPANIDLRSLDVERGATTRLTFDPATDFNPVCAPTCYEIVFASLRGGSPNLFRQVSRGARPRGGAAAGTKGEDRDRLVA